VKIRRRYTSEGRSPYEGIDFDRRVSEIRNPDGSIVFRLEDVEVPAEWSQVATDILAQKYFRKAGVNPPGATDEAGRPLPTGETWVTVRAVLAADSAWAPAGHEVAWGQGRLHPAPAPTAIVAPSRTSPATAPLSRDRGRITVGPAEFDGDTGVLVRLGRWHLDGPRLDLWRAPTDNDAPNGDGNADGDERAWRRIGLHRVHHRTLSVEIESSALVVRTRVSAAATDLAIDAVYRWTSDGDAIALQLDTTPIGAWTRPLPRLGLRLAVPDTLSRVDWFGRGPGEAYRDSCTAARIGRFTADVDAMQTPYAFPQENGCRIDVRWATLTDESRAGIRIEGAPTFQLTARRWTSEDLDAATHAHELRPRGQIFVNADLAQHGLGSASCGPGVREEHALRAAPAQFSLRFSEAT